MNVRLSHIAIANPQISAVTNQLKALALEIETTHDVAQEKVKAAMVKTEISSHFRIELLEPLGDDSPISKFLEKRPAGGIHHLCFEVDQLDPWVKRLEEAQMQVLPPGIRTGARGRVLFIHPKSFGGVLVELEEIHTKS